MAEKKYILFIIIPLFLSVCGALLLPYVTNGYWWDDALNSEVSGDINRFNYSLISFSLHQSRMWFNEGRIILFCLNTYSLFYYIRNLYFIRFIDIIFLISNITLFSFLLRQLHASFKFIGTFLIILLGLFQIRLYFDPIASFATFYQTLGIQLTLAFILLLKWKSSFRLKYLFLSILIVILSLFYYEINIIYFFVAFSIVWFARSGAKRVRDELIVLCPLLIYLAVNFWVRAQGNGSYTGSAFGSLNLTTITYTKQIFSTLPGSYYLFSGKNLISLENIFLTAINSPIAWFITAASGVLLYGFLRSGVKDGPLDRNALIIGGALLFMPPLLVASSKRYQSELTWGLGYLPVYYQYFGLALLGTGGIFQAIRYIPNAFYVLIVSVFSIYLSANWTINRYIVQFAER